VNLTHTISLLELIWTIASLLACIFGLRAFIRAAFDLYYLHRIGKNHLRRYVAITSVVSFTIWTLVPAFDLYVGAWSMTVPQPPGKIPLPQMVNLSFLIASAVLIAVGAFVIDHRRQRIVEMIEEAERNEDEHNDRREPERRSGQSSA
jgi:hypothetical protein